MNAPKKKSLMIGDSWDADIMGAKMFGMDQVYYCPVQDGKSIEEGTSASGSSKTSTTVIDHLEQLMEML